MILSIIVPVYNVEPYLMRCLESIVPEMCDDYELILVDDGSTDCSGAMCDNFAHEHRELNVVVIHQSNGGLSAARNQGIEVAKGEYITFVDSDDHIDLHTLTENMAFLLAHPEVDMLEYPVEVHADSPQSYMLSFADETLQTTDIFVDWIRREGYKHSYAWNKIYIARLWGELRFPVNTYFEDGAIMPDVIRQCKCIHYSGKGCYRYTVHPGTITASYRYAKSRQLFTNNHRLYMTVKEDCSLCSEAMLLWCCCLNQLIDMGRCEDVDEIDYEQIIRAVEKERPSYSVLVGLVLKEMRNMRTLKLLPLPIIGLAAYLRLYVALTPSLR